MVNDLINGYVYKHMINTFVNFNYLFHYILNEAFNSLWWVDPGRE